MNKFIFVGRVSSRPVFKEYKETLVTKFWLVRDDYVGKDQSGVAKTRQVFIPFSAFSSLAKQIADQVLVGDQLIVEAQVYNNNYTDKAGNERFDYNFQVRYFEFGAPGRKKREKFETQHNENLTSWDAQNRPVVNEVSDKELRQFDEGSKLFEHDEKDDIPF